MQIYNSKNRKKELIIPINDKQILLYTCGPTVYDSPHIGNWACFLIWDLLVRTLKSEGYEVTRVMNITDVGHLVSDNDEGEDKIQKGANKEGITAWEVAKKYTDEFLAGMEYLHMIKPTYTTKATDYIKEQIRFIEDLEKKGFTYKISDGIYFNTGKFSNYDKFANLNIKDLKEGARVAINEEKINSTDFALWKFSPKYGKRDMEWESPWGVGFPGWHIECSAMALSMLGESIDIHTGGIDHIPVHHTNEIAQSEARNNKTYSKYWMHCNHMLIDDHKISKSLNNTYSLEDLRKRGFDADDFRLFVFQGHYKRESHFTWDNMQAIKNRLRRWRRISALIHQSTDEGNKPVVVDKIKSSLKKIKKAFGDDLNTPLALKLLDDTLDTIDKLFIITPDVSKEFKNLILCFEELSGINIGVGNISKEQESIIMKRFKLRSEKKWAESDVIREKLKNQNIAVEDKENKQRWYWITN